MRNLWRFFFVGTLLCLHQLAYSDELDRLLERYRQQMMAERFSVTVDTRLSEAVNDIFDQLYQIALNNKQLPTLPRKPKVTVIVSNDVNAYSIAGGDIYITTGLCGLSGIKGDEVAAALAHELSHSLRQHSAKALRAKIVGQLGIQLLGKELGAVGKVAWSIFETGRSQKEEFEADRDAWLLLKTSKFHQTAPLALFRRLELLSEDTPELFSQLFSTHPQTALRTKNYKNWLLELQYGWDFWVGRAQAAGDQVLAEYANTDPQWQAAYKASTGWDIYHLPNYFSKNYQGECTWFTYAARRDEIPLNPNGGNNAVTWLGRCRNANYATGNVAKAGAIPVYDETVAAGAGHLEIIAEIMPDGRWRIWDSNWGPEARDSNYTNGKVRHRIISPSSKVKGFIYWPNNQSEAPPGYPGYLGPALRSSIMLIAEPFSLGDEDAQAQMIRTQSFELTSAELASQQKPRLRLKIRALPKRDPIISINRQEIGRIVATSEEWQTFVLPIPPQLLRSQNLLDIETFIPSLHEGYDDCEIKEVELVLK